MLARSRPRPRLDRAAAHVVLTTVSYGQALLRKHGGNYTAAARDAGMPRTSFRKLVVGSEK